MSSARIILHLAIDLLLQPDIEFMPSAMSIDWKQLALVVTGSAGALIYLFLMILIVGHRRRREFERVLFFVALALFLAYSGTLLLIEANKGSANAPPLAESFGEMLLAAGFLFLPGLIWHVHLAYAASRPDLGGGKQRPRPWVIVLGYLPLLVIAILSTTVLQRLDLATYLYALGVCAAVGVANLSLPALYGARANFGFARRLGGNGPRDQAARVEARFHEFLGGSEVVIFLLLVSLAIAIYIAADSSALALLYSLFVFGLVPGATIAYAIVRYDFFEISGQRNLVYAISAAFVALIYLAIVRRLSVWLAPVFPPEATAAILLFTSLIFFEPLQRIANRVLLKRTREQMHKLQSLSGDLQAAAREGNLPRFLQFAAERIRGDFQLQSVEVSLSSGEAAKSEKSDDQVRSPERPIWAGRPARMRIGHRDAEIGYIEAAAVGSLISGETRAALEFLAEQLPAHIALCRAVEQKLELERELAERERLALVGQMTASISHTLKNPLGSMKTVLQVQLENPALEASTRNDLAIVLAELDRLNSKVNELLSFARPAVAISGKQRQVDLSKSAARVVELLNREAERRRCSVQLLDDSQNAVIRASEEAVADILSNLIVNAVEISPAGANVGVHLALADGLVSIDVIDEGPGISPEHRAHLFEPFFTTKPGGTGLGLATVARRAAELGGSVSCESPVADGRGARFTVRLPIASI
jgi:signal transduction histidine kinase